MKKVEVYFPAFGRERIRFIPPKCKKGWWKKVSTTWGKELVSPQVVGRFVREVIKDGHRGVYPVAVKIGKRIVFKNF